MTIGFDGKRAVNNQTGLGNYSRLVLESLSEADGGEHRLLVYAPEMKANPRLDVLKSRPNVEFRFPGPVGFHGSLWRTFGISNHLYADKVDIYHGLSNELPLNIRQSDVRSVVTLHDVIYRRLPSCYNPVDRVLYDFKYGRSCRNADRVIAISECTKRDAMEFYGIAEDKIDVVYQGCADIFRATVSPEVLDAVRKRYGLPERYIVQVGTIEWRKNLALTASALAALDKDVKLVAVGRDRKGYRKEVMEAARKNGVEADRIIWLEGLPFQDLPAVYRNASVAALPSRYEGFGIPVIEAMECEVPFVGAKGSCLEEAGGEAGRYVDPDSIDEMAEELRIAIEGGADIRQRINEGKAYVRRFDNSSMARDIIEVYRRALS
ncbi:MAG: glycosyltransferase family 4 protein [Muribaculaceae bacterium]|nr:glycosyltransferase family 4 protein [Muribaculaceae bacterium]